MNRETTSDSHHVPRNQVKARSGSTSAGNCPYFTADKPLRSTLKFSPSFRFGKILRAFVLPGAQALRRSVSQSVFNIIYLCSNQSDDQDVRTAWRAHESGRHV